MTDLPIRPAFWNVPLWGEIGVYIIGIAAVAVLIFGVVRNRRLWLGNRQPETADQVRERTTDVLREENP